jgi:hypothetical protein
MRYRLRTLLIVLALGPPLIWLAVARHLSLPIMMSGLSIGAFCRARRAGRWPLIWIPLVWLSGYTAAIGCALLSIEILVRVASADALSDALSREGSWLTLMPADLGILSAFFCGLVATFLSGRPLAPATHDGNFKLGHYH